MKRFLAQIVMPCLLMVSMASAATRVAIVTTETHPDLMAAIELAETACSGEPGMELLDRRFIESALREQTASLSGVLSASQGVAIGKLLDAQVLMILQQPDPQKPADIVVFEAETGIRLADGALPEEALSQQAAFLKTLMDQALRKKNNTDHATRTLSLLAVQNVDLPRSQDYFAQSIAYLVERNLIRSPAIALLERERLDALNAERGLHGGRLENNLLPSVCLWELEVRRGAAEQEIRLFIRATDVEGKTLGEAVVLGPAHAADLAERLQGELVRLLQLEAPPKTTDRKAEARRFQREAEIQAQHKRMGPALRAAEAALALDPANTDAMASLAEYRMAQAKAIPGTNGSMFASSALDLLFTLKAKHIKSKADENLFYYLNWYPDLIELRSRYRSYLGIADTPSGVQSADDRWLMEQYCAGYAIERMVIASLNTQHYLAALTPYVQEWLGKIAADPGAYRNWYLSQVMRTIRERAGSVISPSCMDRWFPRDAAYHDGLLGLFAEMEKHPVPFISPYGKLGRLFCLRETQQLSPQELLEQVRQLDKDIRSTIASNHGLSPKDRNVLYLFLLDLYDLIQDDDERHRMFSDLFGFMLEQHALVIEVGRAATSLHAGSRSYLKQRPLKVDHYERIADDAKRYMEAIDKRANYETYEQRLWNKEWASTQDILDEIRRVRPGPETTAAKPWVDAVCVFDVATRPDARRVDQVCVEDGSLYVLSSRGVSTHRDSFQVDRFALQDSLRVEVGKANFQITNGYPPEQERQRPLSATFGPIVRDDHATYIPTYGQGLLILKDGGVLEQWTSEKGLPSDYVQSVSVLNETLFVASGRVGEEIYLSSCDRSDKTWTLLATSLRREKTSPLDQVSPPFMIRSMMADEPRSQVVFSVDYGYDFNSLSDYLPQIGLWAFRPAEQSFRQLLQLYRSPLWISQMVNDHILVAPGDRNPNHPGKRYRPWQGLVALDLRSDQAGIIMESHHRPIGPVLNGANAGLLTRQIVPPPYAVYRDGVWFAGAQLGCLSSNDERMLYSLMEPGAGDKITQLIQAGNGELLVAASTQKVWLIRRETAQVLRDEDWAAYLAPAVPVRLTYQDAKARTVALTGEFNEWDQTCMPLRKIEPEGWVYEGYLHPGDFAYSFVVDGQLRLDPENKKTKVVNGRDHSRLIVAPPERSEPAL